MHELGESQKRFIERNRHRKSRSAMARELGVEVEAVSAWLKRLDTPGKRAGGKAWYPRFLVDPFARFGPARQAWLQMGAIFLTALAVRMIYLWQVHGTPFWSPVPGGYDDAIFDTWARGILKGDWLGNPELFIYRMPFCGYFLALVYKVFGPSYGAVYVVQSLLGAGTCVLALVAGRMLLTPATGWIAGLLCAFHGPSLFYGAMLMGEVPSAFLLAASLVGLLTYARGGRVAWLAVSGLCLGLAALARGNALVLAGLAGLWLLWRHRRDGVRKLLIPLGVLTLSTAAAIVPVTIRNHVAAKDFVLVSAHDGMNFYIGNAPGATGSFRQIEGISTNPENMHLEAAREAQRQAGRKLKPSEVSAWWYGETFRAMSRQGAGYLFPLFLKKFALYWNHYELPDVWDYQFVREHIPLLAWPLPGFGLLAALAVPGMVLLRKRLENPAPLYLFTLGYAASVILFFVSARYRVPAVPFTALFAAAFLVSLPDLFRAGRRVVAALVISLAAGMGLAWYPVVEPTSFSYSLNALGVAYRAQGKIDLAIAFYKDAVRALPENPWPYYNLGVALEDRGDPANAARCYVEALRRFPRFESAAARFMGVRAFLPDREPGGPPPWK